LASEFLVGFEAKQVVQEARDEDQGSGGGELPDEIEVVLDDVADLQGKEEEGERDQAGDDDRDFADSGDRAGVDFAVVVRLIQHTPSDRQVPAERRKDQGHPEMPKEELVASRPLLKAPVELIELPGEGLTQTVLVANHLSFAGIREDCDSSLTQFNELWLSTKVYRVLPLSPAKDVKISAP
jgi:hypothetical protein